MAAITLPAYAKIRELRMRIVLAKQEQVRVGNLKRMAGPTFSEQWQAKVAFASLSRQNNAALAAIIASCDGKSGTLALPLAAGYATRTASDTTLLDATVPAQDYINIANSGIIYSVGTLLAIGTIDGTFQLVEVVERPSPVTMRVAPRIRYVFSAGTAVAASGISGRFRLASDIIEPDHGPSYGSLAVNLIEAI